MNRNKRVTITREINLFNRFLDPHLYIRAHRSEEILIVNYYYGDKSVATQSCTLDGDAIYLENGRTNMNYRRQGFGTQIRAIILWCAKRAGYKTAYQTSMFMYNSNKSRPRPPSAYIMNKLGFKTVPPTVVLNNMNNNRTEHRFLNLRRGIPGVNAVVRQVMR